MDRQLWHLEQLVRDTSTAVEVNPSAGSMEELVLLCFLGPPERMEAHKRSKRELVSVQLGDPLEFDELACPSVADNSDGVADPVVPEYC